jgi:nucleotide-binding universal stress UspA family protein
MNYTRVIVGTDGSATADRAVETASEVARKLGAELHIVTAYQAKTRGVGAAAGAALADSGAAAALHKEAAQQIAEKAVANWGTDVKATPHAVSGSPADALIEAAGDLQADLIVVGSKGMHGAGRVLGSVPNSVAHGAPCSVLVVKTD